MAPASIAVHPYTAPCLSGTAQGEDLALPLRGRPHRTRSHWQSNEIYNHILCAACHALVLPRWRTQQATVVAALQQPLPRLPHAAAQSNARFQRSLVLSLIHCRSPPSEGRGHRSDDDDAGNTFSRKQPLRGSDLFQCA